MTINLASDQLRRRNIASPITASAIVLGLIGLGFFAIVVSGHGLPYTKAAIAMPATGSDMAAWPVRVTLASDKREVDDGPIDASRECRTEAGIVTECIFD